MPEDHANNGFLLLADIEEVDVLSVYSQLCVWCAVLTLPLVNLHVALNGQDASLGEILCQFQITSNTLCLKGKEDFTESALNTEVIRKQRFTFASSKRMA